MIKVIQGDLLEGEVNIIAHQVNCMGVFGAGLAKQIAKKYPEAKKDYIDYCKNKGQHNLLGDVLITEVEKYKITNLFSQKYYGRYGEYYKKYRRQTNYVALEKTLEELKRRYPDTKIGLPYKIGCGLAGGDWGIVYNIIDKVFKDSIVYLYKIE
ncbi:MAG: macro domain-containing protein [Candidatus Woesearchaeota archaeon]